MTTLTQRHDARRTAVRALPPAVIELTFELAYRRERRNLRRATADADSSRT